MGEDPPGISVGSYLPKIPSACGGGELNSTKILASAYNKDIQNTWHWSNSVYLTPGKCAARLCRSLPTDGIVLLQYKFPHAQQPALAGCPCGAATIKHTTSFHFISAPTYIESHLSQKHSPMFLPPCMSFGFPAACASVHRDTPEPASLFPDRHFLHLCHRPQTSQGIHQVLTFPVLYFATQPQQDPSFLDLLAHWELWDARIFVTNHLLHLPQLSNSWPWLK